MTAYQPFIGRCVAVFLTAGLLLGCEDRSSNQAPTGTAIGDISSAPPAVDPPMTLNDLEATPETQALYASLDQLRHDHLLFGHQDDLAYGVQWENTPGGSDVKAVTGSYPAIYGWEIGGLDIDQDENLDKVGFQNMRQWIKEGYGRGGVITISWHMYSPVSGGNSWDKTPTVHELIPGGAKHEQLKAILDKFVGFNELLAIADEEGKKHYIPIIFRPWHEHNGDWFWWGKGNASEEDYKALWRFTVEYLRNTKGVHNLIYAYSPDRSRIDLNRFEEDYLYGYPGDEYVDIIGLDDYWDVGHEANKASPDEQKAALTASLKGISRIAQARRKIAALTETGNNRLTVANFWTDRLLQPIFSDGDAKQISYVLVWRNANTAREKTEQFFAPYPGQATAEDFKAFFADPRVHFESELPPLYQ